MKKRGISLIVLIVTIIVIIILATSIIVNLVNTNSIKRASESVFKSDIRGFADELSLSLANEYLNNKGEFDAKKVNSYDNEVWYGDKKQNKTVQDIITSSKNTDYVGKIFIEEGKLVLDGFELTKEEVKWAKEINIPVNFEKGVEELVLTSDYTSVTVKVPVEKEEVIKEYEYTIYQIKEIDGKEEKKQVNTVTKKENEIIFSGLAQNKLYEVNVKIRFNNEENEIIEKTGRIDTKGVEENVTFIQNPSAKKENGEINWTAGNVIVTISHKNIPEGYEIQYKLTGGMTQDWTSGEIVEITENTTLVVGRLYNKTLDDEVSVNSHVVSNIDKVAPNNANINMPTESIDEGKTLIFNVTHNDDLSGINIENCKYEFSTISEKLGEDISKYTNSFEENGKDTTWITVAGDYYLHVLSVDKAGNMTETISEQLHVHNESCYSTECKGEFLISNTTTETYYTCTHSHSGSSSYGGGCYGQRNTGYTTCGGSITAKTGTTVASCSTCSGTGKVACTGSFVQISGWNEKCPAGDGIYQHSGGTFKCNTCGATVNKWGTCKVCGKSGPTSGTHNKLSCSNCNGTGKINSTYTYYTCNTCGKSYSSSGYCSATSSYTYYSRNCGKNAGTESYTRNALVYECSSCGKVYTYKEGATSSQCSVCGGIHSIDVTEPTDTSHNQVAKYLICTK